MDIDRQIVKKFKIYHTDSYPRICLRGGRNRLAELYNDLEYKTGLEVGTCIGEYAKFLCQTIPGLQLTCVDPWIALKSLSQAQQDINYAMAVENLAPFGVNILRMFSMEAVHIIPDRSFDFIFIDGAHDFDNVMMDIIMWSKKVKIGGILSGHDYSMYPDVIRAVHAYTASHNIGPWYMTREMKSSYFWVVKK
jgi:predicted O-methyltransferase YrrM